MHKLEGAVAWVTGAGRGIGAAVALELARAGSRVALTSRSADQLQTVQRQIQDHSGQSLILPCDVSDRAAVEKTALEIKNAWAPVQILINNAGSAVFAKIIQTREEDWDSMMQNNVKSAFLCCRAVLPDMIAAGSGQIVNIVSIAGRQPYYNCGAYCASKYALQGFTDVLRMEVRKHGIRVTAVLPGATDTAIWGDAHVERSRMMSAQQVAQTVAAVCCAQPPVMVEEILIRPQGGDL
ncbi:MAG TPA: SDR family oxidoreductase [bacterium]|nr:SDR family oxidoreductase [bacterium]HPN36058.1 SDR family oxidoreductase [bacterium]